MENTMLLRMEGIDKTFPGVKALDGVDFELKAGEVHALVGENGAGKSTLVKILSGIEEQDSGIVYIKGEVKNIGDPNQARQLGIATIFQELSQIPTLTVAENVFLGKELAHNFILDRDLMFKKTAELLEKYQIDLNPRQKLSQLSTAKRQLSEILKAISLNPRILIMDEPTASLTEGEAEILFSIIKDFKKMGVGIIYVSHRMSEIFEIADRLSVLRDGRLIDVKQVEEVDLDQIVKMMVGREVELFESHEKINVSQRTPHLEVKNLSRNGEFADINFTLYQGEILGIAGLVGSGRSELANALFGINEIESGSVLINGKQVDLSSVNNALEHGLALIPEDRHLQGLVLQHNIFQNMSLPVLRRFKRKGLLNYKAARDFVRDEIRKFNIKPDDENKIVNYLSGGNQQKVVVAKWLSTEPEILIVDELTAGIDVNTKSEIHRLIRNLARSGLSVIMISSEMPELLAHSDRIMVMNRGRSLGTFQETDQEQIMTLIMEDNLKSDNDLRSEVS